MALGLVTAGEAEAGEDLSKGEVWWAGLDTVEGLVAVGTEGEVKGGEIT